MPKPQHPGDGPITAAEAHARASATLNDHSNRGQSDEHRQSQKAEDLDDPAKQDPNPGPDAHWSQDADGNWVRDTEG